MTGNTNKYFKNKKYIYNEYDYFCHSIRYQILYLLKVTPIKYKLKLVPHKNIFCHNKLNKMTENTNKYLLIL